MANESLMPRLLLHNEKTQLAAIIEHNFHYHRQQQTLYQPAFIPHLKTVVGLAFTAILVDSIYMATHRPDLKEFLDYFNTDIERDSLAPIALAAVKIIDTGAHVFRKQETCPNYYNTFVDALKKVVQSGLLDSAENNEKFQ